MAVVSGTAGAHAVAGQRLFSSTLNFDDPGIGAELSMTFSSIRDDGRTVNDLGLSITKPIAPGFSILADTDYLGATGAGMPPVHGWGNFALGTVWQVYINTDTESIGSFDINRTFQHTGSFAVRDTFSTWSPQFNFGQRLGIVHANWLRAFAISGAIGADLPDNRQIPKMLNRDLSSQYSIAYVQDFVKYAGIEAPFNNMIPIIGFPMQMCLGRGCHGQTTGYVAPGVIWIGHYFQWGVELLAPVNHRTGNSVGIMLGFDFYLDDLAPHGFGAPPVPLKWTVDMKRTLACSLAFLLAAAASPLALAHAFPDNSSPHVGATVTTAPKDVKVWFDGEIEPVFSTLIVKNAAGKQVSLGKGEVNPKNHVLLETKLPSDPASGTYTVYWSVIAHDGHHTEGHFDFTVK